MRCCCQSGSVSRGGICANAGISVRTFLARDAGKLAILGIVALAVFSLWFVFDPDPRAIVDEFVLKENAGKFAAPGGYLRNFFWGGSSIWRLVVSYPLNAGLLMFPVIALFFVAFKRRTELSDERDAAVDVGHHVLRRLQPAEPAR